MSVQAQPEPGPRSRPAVWLHHGAALAMTGLAAGAAVLTDQFVRIPNLSLVFVLPVVIAAAAFGWGAALTAAAAGVAAFNFLLIEPRYTLRIAEAANIWALALLVVVAGIVSAVGAAARRRAVTARRSADQAEALQGLARDLTASSEPERMCAAAVGALSRWFKAPAIVLRDAGQGLNLAAGIDGADLSASERDAAAWTLAQRLATRRDAYPNFATRFDFWPIASSSPGSAGLVIGVDFSSGERPDTPERLVEAVGAYLAVALERAAYVAEALEAGVRLRGEQLKADLLAAVSHDLKTPLATILFTLQSLRRFDAEHSPEVRSELLAVAEAETARLSGLVGNLLDMSRLDAGAVPVSAAPAALADLVASALARAQGQLADHPVTANVDPHAPPVLIDYGLAETALANVLENAGKYSPVGAPILVRGAASAAGGVIEVLDEGRGFPEPAARLFEKFERGVEGDGRPPGTGLGLAIARGFLAAQGGTIEAVPRLDREGGALVRLTLPLAPRPDCAS